MLMLLLSAKICSISQFFAKPMLAAVIYLRQTSVLTMSVK